VGELGYVFRDMPFKSLDMCSAQSVDAALLDFFTVDAAQTPLVAGKVDLNTRQAQVLQCVLNGSFRVGDPTTSGTLPPMVAMSGSDAAMISGTIVAVTTGTTGPFQDKANFVTTMANVIWPPLSQISTIFDVKAGGATTYPTIKTQREAPVRALADVANTRTWNLLIDVIAQTGQYPPGSTSLNQFQVTGERRYWLHVAIDRFTGKVVDERLEPVYE
jgi:hypothetical protein